MDKIKRMILLAVPCSICNFRCSYCYLSQRDQCYQNQQPQYKYSPEHVAKAFSQKRVGGLAYINVCAEGETLLAKDIDKYVYKLLKEGHYIEFVTNLTVTPILEKMLKWDKSLLKHLEFKCSFHYIELLKRDLLQTFADNVHKIWKAGSSANIEITPCDELIPHINDIKTFSMKEFGALPHLTIARNDRTDGIEYLTEMPIEEYDRTWSQFDSDFWKFKKTIFMKRRTEFCYAGDWLLYVNIENGNTTQCYKSNRSQNVFQNIDKSIEFSALGRCKEAHCYNGHMLMTLGCIPEFTTTRYGNIRNRVRVDGGEWLHPEMKQFLNSMLCESNEQYSQSRIRKINLECSVINMKEQTKRIIKNCLPENQKNLDRKKSGQE